MIVNVWIELIAGPPSSVTRIVITFVVDAWSRFGLQRKTVLVVGTGLVFTMVEIEAPIGAPGSRLKLTESPFGSEPWSFTTKPSSGRITASAIGSSTGAWFVVVTKSVPLE